jgi:hypothetical protein
LSLPKNISRIFPFSSQKWKRLYYYIVEGGQMERLYDFPAAVRLIGPVRQGKTEQETKRMSYYAIRYAVKYKRLVEPREYGKAMLFTEGQIRELKRHFQGGDGRRGDGKY